MPKTINDFVIQAATVNGTGSQSANNILLRSLFRLGLCVGGKNLFPSNISGLPTWFSMRVNSHGHTGRRPQPDIVLAMNPATIQEDIESVRSEGVFIYNRDLRFNSEALRPDTQNIGIPFRELIKPLTDSAKTKKLLANMAYVGVLAKLLGVDENTLTSVVRDQFPNKPAIVDMNLKSIAAGREYVRENFETKDFPFQVEPIPGGTQDKILIDGNSAAAMGLVFGGCTLATWYPITPSSSLIESFQKYAGKYRQDANGRNNFAVVQAEDELASISMVIGAGWAGARAMTATSGPGFSLMSEAAGLSYYAEVPAVIWNIQRVGPSTGLPTRTMQADVLAAERLSHGDTRHVVLMPGTPKECFEMAQTSLDLAERLQTLVIVLSDLDLGMNFHVSAEFSYPAKDLDRGKVLTAEDLEQISSFARYQDVDNDGIPYRTLPGTEHQKAAYFTRGSGHDENANYTEDNKAYQKNAERLKKKYETARQLVPSPVVEEKNGAKAGIIAFGSSDTPVKEALEKLAAEGLELSYLRLRALPLSASVRQFLENHERVYIVEQNRDAQLKTLIQDEFPELANRLDSVLHYDGLPLPSTTVVEQISYKEQVL